MNPFSPARALSLLASLLLAPASALAAGFDEGATVRVAGVSAGGTLNVRAAAGLSSPVVAGLDGDRTGLTILECTATADWCRVAGEGGPLGWVAARYLAGVVDAGTPAPSRFSEAARLVRVTGIALSPDGTATVPELPPYLIGEWDSDGADGRAACSAGNGATRITVSGNGLRIGAATARFKNAIFRDGGYSLTTLLMRERDVINAVPQRALYRLEPGEETLALSGDVLAPRVLRRCDG